LETYFYIPDPRDPFTGEQFPPGPIRLHPNQKRILRAALTKVNGRFPYSTVLYSTIKKSGKTRVAAGIAAWFAATQGPYNEIYCLANDGKQSSDRILSAIKQAIHLNPYLRESWKVTATRITLPNGTFIEAIPCDPKGQAGSNPGLTVWSEMWGYAHTHKERLWTEMTIPPTRWGKALRLVESYAGYVGESNVLYDLYTVGVEGGRRHPAFTAPGDPPLYLNDAANMLAYWDKDEAARRMPWQRGAEGEAYYTSESIILPDAEFRRIHKNHWVEPLTKAIPIEWWDACQVSSLPPLGPRAALVVGVDASVSGDCTALIGVTRQPGNRRKVAVRLCRIFTPPKGGKIDLTATVEATLREWREAYNITKVVYDEYQLHKMMTDLRREHLFAIEDFGQQTPRSKADKQLRDVIQMRDIVHSGIPELREHIDNTESTPNPDKFRFVKPQTVDKSGRARKAKPIDGAVALSMATDICLRLIT
jgi:hypothetical protein